MFLGNFYLTFTLGLALAILAYLKHLNIGEGDFLYLASASLIFPFSQILLAIEIACLLGLIYFLVSKDLKQKIAFVPFLFVSILFLTFIT
nr:precorrin-2 methylase [uncultured Streptococcus sp.]